MKRKGDAECASPPVRLHLWSPMRVDELITNTWEILHYYSEKRSDLEKHKTRGQPECPQSLHSQKKKKHHTSLYLYAARTRDCFQAEIQKWKWSRELFHLPLSLCCQFICDCMNVFLWDFSLIFLCEKSRYSQAPYSLSPTALIVQVKAMWLFFWFLFLTPMVWCSFNATAEKHIAFFPPSLNMLSAIRSITRRNCASGSETPGDPFQVKRTKKQRKKCSPSIHPFSRPLFSE